MGAKILIIDHNDSFTYNLAGLFETARAGQRLKAVELIDIWPVDALPLKDLQQIWKYDGVVLSPGPGLPEDYPAVTELLKSCLEGPRYMPVLGICLGLQTLVSYFGGTLYNLPRIQHGRQADMLTDHIDSGAASVLFSGLKFPVKVGLYHSWAMDSSVPVQDLEILATAQLPARGMNGGAFSKEVVMAIRHRCLPVYGLQFHPESYMTPDGDKIIGNWLQLLD